MTDALVAASWAAIEKGSKSFALASRLFDPVLRDRATLLYAWCRHADDVIDGQADGFGRVEYAGTPAERLAELEAKTRAALALGGARLSISANSPANSGHAGVRQHDPVGVERDNPADAPPDFPFAALARVAAETAMPERYPLDLIEGFRSDVEERRFVTFGDTLTYCYHVAGCVGVMMAIVMGVAPDDRATLERACDLGMAFQLNNIARDVIEDAGNGRCYLPEEWLTAAGLSSVCSDRHASTFHLCHPRFRGDDESKDEISEASTYFAAPANRAALAAVVARLVDEAERYEASSRFGTPALPPRAAWAVLAAADIYGGIGRRVRAEGAAALDRRVTTSKAEKLLAVARSLPLALSRARRWRAPGPSRAGLWTLPWPGMP